MTSSRATLGLAAVLLLAAPLTAEAAPARPVNAVPLAVTELDHVAAVHHKPGHVRGPKARPPGWSRGRKVGWGKKGGPKRR